ncbi:thiolase family protein [Streptomyces sp. NBC_00569]|uniref:thiolase family protein n=1 Tax=unclassified Streptomyces TaxID=2593676 RepID=UPI002259DE03|nr:MULTISPECIES: thiolase family protein [unclassified Streptomyces]MCX5443350.1 thiolase family protein [Streptomyces sp. NBC_00063]WUB98757.1 thiolase family protein [Streptomyces sp. NBC_00569]
MSSDVLICGAGRTPFGRSEASGRQLAVSAVRAALADAGIEWSRVRAAFGGSDSAGLADTLVAQLGLTGLPFVNVKNGCATGGSALISAVNAIRSGMADVVLAVGFDKHPRGAFDPRPEDWGLGVEYGSDGLMVTTQFFGMKIQRYMYEHGITPQTLALVAEKAYRNGARTAEAWRRKPVTAAEILDSGMVSDPLTRFMFCSPGAGAAALVLCSPEIARTLDGPSVTLRSAAVRTRRFGSFEVFSPSIPGGDLTSVSRDAAAAAFAEAGIGPGEVDVCQLQDTESGAEVMHMAECGFCEDGEQERLVASGATEIGGSLPVNTDGGCIANGEPIGASGLRQVYEVVQQLRGRAGERQVPGTPRVGFTHVYGAPGVSACTVLAR